MLDEGRMLDKLIAEKVFGYQIEVVKPDWYPFEVYLFKWAERGIYSYSLDENACNAQMYRNGVDESDGTLDPLPFYSSSDFTDFMSIHEPMLARGARFHWYCNPDGGKPVYAVEIVRVPKSLPRRCRGKEVGDMAWALCDAVREYFEIEEAEMASTK